MSDTSALDAALAAEREEWGTYVAAVPIDLNGIRAFNPGHPVPVGHVTRGIVDASFVTRVASNVPESTPISTTVDAPAAPEMKG